MLGITASDVYHAEGWRLWFNYRDEAEVVHTSGLEYDHDFDLGRLLSPTVYQTEEAAVAALAKLKEDAAKVLGLQITYVITRKS